MYSRASLPCNPGNVSQRFHGHRGPHRFFNPRKKTVIYVHGWGPGTSKKKFREGFYTSYNSKKMRCAGGAGGPGTAATTHVRARTRPCPRP